MKNLKYIFPIFIFFPLFFSCNSSSETDQQKKIDSMFPQQNSNSNVSAKDSSSDENTVDDKPEKPFRLSPADSARVADSVYRNKNGVRDFN